MSSCRERSTASVMRRRGDVDIPLSQPADLDKWDRMATLWFPTTPLLSTPLSCTDRIHLIKERFGSNFKSSRQRSWILATMEHVIDPINLVRSDNIDTSKARMQVGRALSAGTGYHSRQEIRELNLASHCTPITNHPLLTTKDQ